MTKPPLRVLLVDDSAAYRDLIREFLSQEPEIELVGSASNGQLAIDLISKLHPELLLLNLEMPVLDGVGLLQYLRNAQASVGAIMLASRSIASTEKAAEALSLGALDFVAKPAGSPASGRVDWLRNELLPRIQAFASWRRALPSVKAGKS